MTQDELVAARCPFHVVQRSCGDRATVKGFSRRTPDGRAVAVAHFVEGGWIELADLLRHFDVIKPESLVNGALHG